jgi:endonuclease G
VAALAFLCAVGAVAEDSVYRVDHEGFTVWLDCIEHGALRFRYNAQRDTGVFPREDDYWFDPEAPPECQPFNTDTFRREEGATPTYDRSHLVPANHLDYSELALRQSNYMTNIVPMTAALNRGAWLATEEIIECLRDVDELLVVGGVLWGNDATNDYFVMSHGIRTPDFYWKVIIRGDGRTIAWLMPNSADATRAELDKFIITPAKLQRRIKAKIPEVPKDWLKKKPRTSWKKPPGCDPG